MADAEDAASRRAQQRVGWMLKDKWRLERVLGVGGFGAVYAATHRTRKRVAIKILHPEVSINAEMRERFLREAYAANTVDHPGVVSVFDDDVTEDGSAFLVMELCEGESVDARAERMGGRLPVQEVIFVADQLLDVLAAAHDKGILHRDVKPENLFATRGGQIKVLDFGIARMRESGDPRATRSGTLMGTPAFMPPEQARGAWREVDARSDLWAVGATMFTLLTGRLVHAAHTAPEMLVSAMTKPAPPLSAVWPDAPAPLAQVVDRALAFDREARWPDARQMQAAVRGASSMLLGASQASAPRIEVPVSAPDAGTPMPSMSRAEAVAFANTLAAEKVPSIRVATGQAGGGRRGLWIALAVGGLVVSAGVVVGARELITMKAVPPAPETTAATTAAAAPPATGSQGATAALPAAVPPASVAPASVAPEPSVTPPAPTPSAAASAPGTHRPGGPVVAPVVGVARPSPPAPAHVAPAPAPVAPAAPQDPYSRRR